MRLRRTWRPRRPGGSQPTTSAQASDDQVLRPGQGAGPARRGRPTAGSRRRRPPAGPAAAPAGHGPVVGAAGGGPPRHQRDRRADHRRPAVPASRPPPRTARTSGSQTRRERVAGRGARRPRPATADATARARTSPAAARPARPADRRGRCGPGRTRPHDGPAAVAASSPAATRRRSAAAQAPAGLAASQPGLVFSVVASSDAVTDAPA